MCTFLFFTYNITRFACDKGPKQLRIFSPLPLFLNILWKWNNLVSVRPNYFIFMGYLRKMRYNQRSDPPPPPPPPTHTHTHTFLNPPTSNPAKNCNVGLLLPHWMTAMQSFDNTHYNMDLDMTWSCWDFQFFYHGILPRNNRKMTMTLSFSYYSFVKFPFTTPFTYSRVLSFGPPK